MSSGIPLNSQCQEVYQTLKTGKKLSFVTYKISDDAKEIVVADTSSSKDWGDFVGTLPEDQCRWAVYDFEFPTPDGPRNKILFVSWSPDTAKVKAKMMAASSKDTLRRALDGIGVEIQATDAAEISLEEVTEKVARQTR